MISSNCEMANALTYLKLIENQWDKLKSELTKDELTRLIEGDVKLKDKVISELSIELSHSTPFPLNFWVTANESYKYVIDYLIKGDL